MGPSNRANGYNKRAHFCTQGRSSASLRNGPTSARKWVTHSIQNRSSFGSKTSPTLVQQWTPLVQEAAQLLGTESGPTFWYGFRPRISGRCGILIGKQSNYAHALMPQSEPAAQISGPHSVPNCWAASLASGSDFCAEVGPRCGQRAGPHPVPPWVRFLGRVQHTS